MRAEQGGTWTWKKHGRAVDDDDNNNNEDDDKRMETP